MSFVIWRRRLSYWPALTVLALGVSAELLFSVGVAHFAGRTPLRPPFLSARLIDDGPGRDYLIENCAKSSFSLCSFYKDLPRGSDAMLWSGKGEGFISMTSVIQEEWSKQDIPFAYAVLTSKPLATFQSSLRAILRQSTGYLLDDVTAPLDNSAKLPSSVRSIYDGTLAASNQFPTRFWNGLSLPLILLSFVLIFCRARHLPIEVRIIFLGLIADIIICGALSTPHDRYLTRAIWLLPVIAACCGSARRREHGSDRRWAKALRTPCVNAEVK
jgi:hypothetical protein